MAKEKENEIQNMNESEREFVASTMKSSQEIIEQSRQEVSRQSDGNNGSHMVGETEEGPIGKNFKGLPMRELIGAPLLAAAESNQQLAMTTIDFINRVAFEKDTTNNSQKTRVVSFEVNHPVEIDGTMTDTTEKVEAPLISLIPTPTLYVDHVDVDFQMEVTDTNVNKSSTTAETSTNASAGFWRVKAEISGKVSTARENTRTTNQTAKYQVHVSASQQPQTEGMSKLMDILTNCVVPKSESKGA